MDEDHRTILKQNIGQLQDIICTPDFLGELQKHNVLPDDWIELIKYQTTESERWYKLTSLLPKSGPDAFDRFVLALGEQYYWIAEKLKSDLQELKTSKTPQIKSTIYIGNGIQCDLYSAVSQNMNQEKFRLIYHKITSLVHLTEYNMNNKTDETDPCRSHGTIKFESLEEGMDALIKQANQLKTNIDLLQEKEEKMKHDFKDLENKLGANEMENKNLRKKISELDSEILKFKYEAALTRKDLELKQKQIIDLNQTLQTSTYHREKTLDELKRIVVSHKCNPDLGDVLVYYYSPINTNTNREKYRVSSRHLGKSQPGTDDKSKDELYLTHRWLEKLHQLLNLEMRQEMQVDRNMDCSQISRDTIETAICNLLEKNKQLEEKIEQFEQLKLAEVIPSGKKVKCIGNKKSANWNRDNFN